MTRYQCSIEAVSLWGRLLRLHALKRAKGDCQIEGVDWAERALARGTRHCDLGTDARLLYVSSQRALELLAIQGRDAMVASALAKRRLAGHGTGQEELRYNLDKPRRNELLDGAREWLRWSLDEEAFELPELPF